MKNLLNIILVLTATLDCNQNCPWCIRKSLNNQYSLPLDNMTVEVAKKILEEYPKTTQIVLTGGEPLLNLDLFYFLVNTGRRIKVSTNGSILLPDLQTVLKNDVLFDISVNSIDKPPLYKQLLDAGYPKQKIRAFIYLRKDLKQVEQILDSIGMDSIRGYEVLPDIWIEKSHEYEQFILNAVPMLSEIQKKYGKDHGFSQYIKQGETNEPVCLKIKFSPKGEKISDLWTQGLPKEIRQEQEKHIFNDVNVMRYGAKSFKKGIEGFNMPVEYYTSLMYEEMKKYIDGLT